MLTCLPVAGAAKNSRSDQAGQANTVEYNLRSAFLFSALSFLR
jgi:hypothetical protein